MQNKKRGLGKGLDSLLSSSIVNRTKQVSHDLNVEKTQQFVDDIKGELQYISIENLEVGKYQPRKTMSKEALEDLANSIRSQGIIQPIVVRKIDEIKYEIIAGERRWRASKLVGLKTVPCLIKTLDDNAAIAIALIENIQRENLNSMEEAVALQRLLEEFTLTHQEIANAIGKSRTTVSNLLRLNNLNKDVKELLANGSIEMGHARALLGCGGEIQSHIAKMVVEKNATVRQTELYVKKATHPTEPEKISKEYKEPLGLINILQDDLGFTVNSSMNKNGSGKLTLKYKNMDELNQLFELIKK